MAPPKAYRWPSYIYNDPAVRTLDERGRFVICAVCAQYAICGGKKPKPVTLNGCYRTRAWEVHKQRTRAHNAHREGRSMNTYSDMDAYNPPLPSPISGAFLGRVDEGSSMDPNPRHGRTSFASTQALN